MIIKERCRNILYQMHTGAVYPHSFTTLSIGGHIGINKTVECISSQFLWPDITGDVKLFCNTCRTCQLYKDLAIQKTSTVMHPIPIPIKVMSQIRVDIMHMSRVENKTFLITVVDYFTKYVEMGALPNKKAMSIALWLYENIFCRLRWKWYKW